MIMFDDSRNELPDSYYWFSDEIPFGKKIRVTMELVDNDQEDNHDAAL